MNSRRLIKSDPPEAHTAGQCTDLNRHCIPPTQAIKVIGALLKLRTIVFLDLVGGMATTPRRG